MIVAVGSNRGKSSSSYRIVVGGMFGASTWQDDEKNRGPIVTESCDRPVEPSRDARMDEGDFANVLEESMALMVENDITVAVICGNETQSCTSLDAISKSGNVGEVVAVWTCPSITSDNNEYKENELGHMLDCQKKILKKLKKSTSKEKKIRAIIIDESAPFEMGRIVYNIFESENNREHIILDETIMVLAAALDDTENWRKNLIERFRVDFFPEEPSFTAVVQFKSSESTMGLSITSSGDPTFFQGLVGVTGSIEKRTGLMADVRNVDGGQFRETDYIDDETYQFFLPGDYDQRSPLDQWTSQQPMGRQTVFQLEIDFNKLKEGMLSATIIKRALEATFLLVKAEIMNNSEVHGFTDVGDGSVVIGFWQGGSAAVLWDGKLHVDINLFTYAENVEIHREFETGFKSQILSLKSVLKDEQPRGYGRVVNFSADVEPRADAHWALGIKDE